MLPASIDHPLFDAAKERFEALQPDPAAIAAHLTTAGLHTTLTYIHRPLSVPADRYLRMVRARYMSVLAGFSDSAIDAGCEEIRARHRGATCTFPDRYALILGRKHQPLP
ncbi:hypothetical protein ACIQXD_01380 [Streptomyces uncialis]|uniref:hypothetical protein n=1 Tax=Streptomyces uncialis TaxID=1048205 RepID=UPI00380C8F8D